MPGRRSQHALGMRRFAGGATEFEFGRDHVRVATDNLGSLWFPLMLAARQAEEPGIRSRVDASWYCNDIRVAVGRGGGR